MPPTRVSCLDPPDRLSAYAVEIEAHHGDEIHEMSDFFTIKNGKVTRLAVYQGPIRKKS